VHRGALPPLAGGRPMRDGPTAPKRTPLEAWVSARTGATDSAGLMRYQLRALCATVARAQRRSEFYAATLEGVDAAALTSLADVARLPFTTADDVRSRGIGLLCVRPGDVSRIVTLPTSGTTGEPKRVHFTAADQESTIDFFEHGMSVLVEPGDRVLILLPGERPGSVGDLLRRGLARMQVEGVVHGPVRDQEKVLTALEEGAFDTVVGIPVQVLGLARRSVAAGDGVRLKSVLLSTDHAARSLVAAVEDAWGCRVFDHYGTTEMGLGGGVECEAHVGYHLREPDLLFEVVDPETGASLPDGQYGEVVFTTLAREAMPLIRYRTGDYSRFLPQPCPCGSWLPLIERVGARLSGRLALGADEVLDVAMLDEALFALPEVLDHRATVRRVPDRRTDVAVEVLVAVGADAAVTRRRATVALKAAPGIAGHLRAGNLDVTVAVTSVPWSASDGTAKRTFELSSIEEEPV